MYHLAADALAPRRESSAAVPAAVRRASSPAAARARRPRDSRQDAGATPQPPRGNNHAVTVLAALRNICGLPERSIVRSGLLQRQPNLNCQSAFGPVPCLHTPSMQADRPFGNRQTQADASGPALAGVVNAIK